MPKIEWGKLDTHVEKKKKAHHAVRQKIKKAVDAHVKGKKKAHDGARRKGKLARAESRKRIYKVEK